MSLFEQATFGLIALYGLATVCGIAGMIWRLFRVRQLACLIVLFAFVLQTLSFLGGVHSTYAEGLSWGAYLQLMAWFVVLCGLAGWWKMRIETPPIFGSTLALILFLMSLRYLAMHIRMPASVSGPFYALHIGTLFLSLGLMAITFGAGLLFIFLEKKIKNKTPLSGFAKDFPALAILDKINYYSTAFGFPLYTIGMITGFIFATGAFGRAVSGDPKEIISVIVWVLYSILFHMRMVLGHRGRKPAQIAIVIFCISVFSLLIVNTFMDTHHAFSKRQ